MGESGDESGAQNDIGTPAAFDFWIIHLIEDDTSLMRDSWKKVCVSRNAFIPPAANRPKAAVIGMSEAMCNIGHAQEALAINHGNNPTGEADHHLNGTFQALLAIPKIHCE